MVDVPEGNAPKDPVKDKAADALYRAFEKDIWAAWATHQRAQETLNPSETYRVLCQALISVAARGAVDVGITMDQFTGMAALTWVKAEQAAPKFS